MGAWGTESFENDTALDWVYELEKTNETRIIWQAVEAVFSEDYVDSDVAMEALGAIEVAAGLKGKAHKSLPDEVETWLSENNALSLPENFNFRAEEVLDKIIGAESELKELWEESESFQEWLTEINDLKIRITS